MIIPSLEQVSFGTVRDFHRLNMSSLDELFGHDDDDDNLDGVQEKNVTYSDDRVIALIGANESVGGGRGLFSKRSVSSGTLVLAEIPLLAWPPEISGIPDASVRMKCMMEALLSSPSSMEAMKSMFPFSIGDVSSIEVLKLRSHMTDEAIELIAIKFSMTSLEVMRLSLVLQHNGFGSSSFRIFLSRIHHISF